MKTLSLTHGIYIASPKYEFQHKNSKLDKPTKGKLEKTEKNDQEEIEKTGANNWMTPCRMNLLRVSWRKLKLRNWQKMIQMTEKKEKNDEVSLL